MDGLLGNNKLVYNQSEMERVANANSDDPVDQAPNESLPGSLRRQYMDEQELPPIQISFDDISEANRLSLHCPICGSGVENHAQAEALVPVVCNQCGTLYHRACWEQSGNKCAVLGCGHDTYHVYGHSTGPALKVKYTDLPEPSVNGRQAKRYKEEQRQQVERLQKPGLLSRFWRWLLDQIQIG